MTTCTLHELTMERDSKAFRRDRTSWFGRRSEPLLESIKRIVKPFSGRSSTFRLVQVDPVCVEQNPRLHLPDFESV